MDHDAGPEPSTVADTRAVPLRVLLVRAQAGAAADMLGRVAGDGGSRVLSTAAFTSAT